MSVELFRDTAMVQLKTNTSLQMEAAKIGFKVI